jgi:hypothetical protein
MATTSAFAVTWIWLLVLGGAGALPLGGAPLPADPVLSAIAPPECLWYAAYSGQGPADPESTYVTEKLFAEPEVQRFAKEVETHLIRALRRAGGPGREQRVLAEQAPKLIKTLLSRPFAIYLEEAKPNGNSLDAQAAFVLNAGDQRDEVAGAIDELLKLAGEKGVNFSHEQAEDIEWRRPPLPPTAPLVRLGWKDEYLIIAVGARTPEKLLDRMGGSPPDWLTKLREEHPIKREISIGYINVEGLLKRIQPLVDAKDPKAWPVIEKLGVTSIKAVHAVSGYDDEACASVAHIVTDGNRPGILGFLPHKPLEAADLAPIPKDALLAFAVNIDVGETFDNVVKLVSQFEPKAQEESDRAMWEIENHLGVNVREDVLSSLDDTWAVYLPAGDLMVSWLQSAAAVRVKDADQLRKAIDKIVDKAKEEISRHGDGAAITESTVGDHKLYTLQLPAPAPVAPTWSVGEDWFVISLSPQTTRTVLGRKAEDSLATAAGVKEALEVEGGVSAIAYQDTPQLVRKVYPFIQMGLQMLSGELRKQGVEFDLSTIPSEEVIIRHLKPSIATVSHASDGFHINSRHSFPGAGNLAAAGPVGAALLLPAVHKAREAARENAEMNNMKQIALGFLNYESAQGHFPTDIYDKDGKPLLSWRVQLLPYLEQMTAYQGIKRDEPWDSPHNRQFLAKMPAVFDSPSASQPGKTRFLAFKGDKTAFPGARALRMQAITDGTSNTLMVVEVAPERAVEWTKPADINFKPDKPFDGLQFDRGAFLAAFIDGSVRRITLAISPETMKRLVIRDDGEVIDGGELSAPPAPRPPEPSEPADQDVQVPSR